MTVPDVPTSTQSPITGAAPLGSHGDSASLGLDDGNDKLRQVFAWVIVTGAAAFAITSLVIIVRAGFREGLHADLYFTVFRDHFVAVVGLPMAAVAALFIVLVLRSTDGPLEFEVLGLKLRGGSGPVVLWLLCFLGIAAALKLMWSETTFDKNVPSYLVPHHNGGRSSNSESLPPSGP